MEKPFTLTVHTEIQLSVDDVWPDGDAPRNPTFVEVMELLKNECVSRGKVISEWGLEEHTTVTVSQPEKGGEVW